MGSILKFAMDRGGNILLLLDNGSNFTPNLYMADRDGNIKSINGADRKFLTNDRSIQLYASSTVGSFYYSGFCPKVRTVGVSLICPVFRLKYNQKSGQDFLYFSDKGPSI